MPRPGLEPGCLAAAHFKCDVSADFTIGASKSRIKHQNLVEINGLDAGKECACGFEDQFYQGRD